MKIHIQYASLLATATGCRGETVEVEGDTTLSKLITQVVDEHGESLRQHLCTSAEQLKPGMLVSVNGKQITDLAECELQDGDEVLFLSAISGG